MNILEKSYSQSAGDKCNGTRKWSGVSGILEGYNFKWRGHCRFPKEGTGPLEGTYPLPVLCVFSGSLLGLWNWEDGKACLVGRNWGSMLCDWLFLCWISEEFQFKGGWYCGPGQPRVVLTPNWMVLGPLCYEGHDCLIFLLSQPASQGVYRFWGSGVNLHLGGWPTLFSWKVQFWRQFL